MMQIIGKIRFSYDDEPLIDPLDLKVFRVTGIEGQYFRVAEDNLSGPLISIAKPIVWLRRDYGDSYLLQEKEGYWEILEDKNGILHEAIDDAIRIGKVRFIAHSDGDLQDDGLIDGHIYSVIAIDDSMDDMKILNEYGIYQWYPYFPFQYEVLTGERKQVPAKGYWEVVEDKTGIIKQNYEHCQYMMQQAVEFVFLR